MNHLASIRAQLEILRQRLMRHPVFVRGTGSPVDDPAHNEETHLLDSVRQSLGILIRDLNNHKHLLSAQEQAVWRTPRDSRFSRTSSIGDQQRNLDELLRIAADVQRLLEDLIRKSGLLSTGEVACGIGETISRLFAQSHNHDVLIPAGRPAYKPLAPGQFNASPEAATIAVFVALQAYTSLRRRRGSSAA